MCDRSGFLDANSPPTAILLFLVINVPLDRTVRILVNGGDPQAGSLPLPGVFADRRDRFAHHPHGCIFGGFADSARVLADSKMEIPTADLEARIGGGLHRA